MREPNWQFPSLTRDLAIIGGGLLVASAVIGAGVATAIDILWRRHRS